MRSDVREAIELCKSVGLEPVLEGGQYKVRNSDGVLLFNFHRTPSDTNWLWNIRRFLRQLGLLRKDDYKKHSKGGNVKRGAPAIDLVALKRAQDQAAAHGERIPTLEDFDGTTEFFRKIKDASTTSYSAEAQEEAIDLMTVRADAPRINAAKQRFRKFLDTHTDELRKQAKTRHPSTRPGTGEYSEFARVATQEVAATRSLRSWKTEAAAIQAIRTFALSDMLPALWVVQLMEATMDHLEGLKWGEIDESRKKLPSLGIVDIPPEPTPLDTSLDIPPKDLELEEIPPSEEVEEHGLSRIGPIEVPEVGDNLRERYADALLEVLIANKDMSEYGDLEPLLSRLDKLVGIA